MNTSPGRLPFTMKIEAEPQHCVQQAEEVRAALNEARELLLSRPQRRQELEVEIARLEGKQSFWQKLSFGLYAPFQEQLKKLREELAELQAPEADLLLLRLKVRTKYALGEIWEFVNAAFQQYAASEALFLVDKEEGQLGKQMELFPISASVFAPSRLDIHPYPLSLNLPGVLISFCALGVFLEPEGKELQFLTWAAVSLLYSEEPFRSKQQYEDSPLLFQTWEYTTAEGQPDPNLPAEENPKVFVHRLGRLELSIGQNDWVLLNSNYEAGLQLEAELKRLKAQFED